MEKFTINSSNAAELGKRGGRKSGEVRRAKRNMRETLELLLGMKMDAGKIDRLETLKAFHDIDKTTNTTVSDRMMVNLVKLALSGDLDAIKLIRDQIGEKPKDEIELTTIQVPKFEGEDEIPD